MTITIELTDEQAQWLAEEASRLHTTPTELAAQRLFHPWSLSHDEANSQDIDQTIDYIFEKNAELYRRLS